MSDETVVALFGLSRIQSSENSASWIDLCSAQPIMCSSYYKKITRIYEEDHDGMQIACSLPLMVTYLK